jgi:hypothetical protein
MASEQARQLVEEGKALLKTDLRGGLAKLRQALTIDPDYPELEDEIFLREDAVEKLDDLLNYVVVLLKDRKEYQAYQMLKELPDNYIIEDRKQLLGDLAVRINRTEGLIKQINSLPQPGGEQALALYEEAASLVPDYPGLQDQLADARNSVNRYKVYLDSLNESIGLTNFAKADELLRAFREGYPDDLNIGIFETSLINKKKELGFKRSLKKSLLTAGILAGLALFLGGAYFGYETLVINRADRDWQRVSRLLEEKRYTEVEIICRKIVAELGKVRVFSRERKSELLDKTDQLLRSESVQQGIAGLVMAEGADLPADDPAKVKNVKGLMAEAASLSAAGNYHQAIAKYQEALPLAGDLDADLAARFTGEIAAAIRIDRQATVKVLVNEALELNRGDNSEGALSRINEAEGLIAAEEPPDPDLTEMIGQARQQIIQAKFQAVVAEGDRHLGAGRANEALLAYDRALGYARDNELTADNTGTLSRIGQTAKVVRVKDWLRKGDDSFRQSRWRGAIAHYTTALKLYRELELKQELPVYNRALANLAAARRAAALEDLRQGELEAGNLYAAGEWAKAKAAYERLPSLVDQSGYPQDPEFSRVRIAAQIRLGEVDERLLIVAKKDYLVERHRAILRKVFKLDGKAALLDPQVVFLTEDENGMKYSIAARSYERMGGEGKYTNYEVIYAFNRKNGEWVLLSQDMSSKVSRAR